MDLYIKAINDRNETGVKYMLSSDLRSRFNEEFARTNRDPVRSALHDLDVQGAEIDGYEYKILHESGGKAWVEVDFNWSYANNSHVSVSRNIIVTAEGAEWKFNNFFPFSDPENFTVDLGTT